MFENDYFQNCETDNTMLHFGPPNNAKYQMGGDIITQSTEEKDLGITIDVYCE
jgi:hypothetical protein